ncbi:palmitoyltransferase ZDHHC3-like [Acinonyx jubatus]|uniref:Palmitoyltransferase n=1 Tax=Acinonyx jubatus TaxID=32536 RepID=A0A6J2AFM7_ACIJB|nr:palmitoyltransferase ZDHHC3-like [Acinonyx jubatus]
MQRRRDPARPNPAPTMPARVPALPAPGRTHREWFVCDIPGIACAAGTWLPARGPAYFLAHDALFHLLALAAHARTALTDAGAVPLGAARGGPRCSLCGSARPARTHHCTVCGRRTRKLDLRPWVDNCVGEDDQKGPTLRRYARGDWDALSSPTPRAPVVFLLPVALKGFVFASAMFASQMRAICTDRARIEQLRSERPGTGRTSAWMNLKAVFGHRLSLAWISPFASPQPRAANTEVLLCALREAELSQSEWQGLGCGRIDDCKAARRQGSFLYSRF